MLSRASPPHQAPAEHVGRKHRRVSPRSLHLGTGKGKAGDPECASTCLLLTSSSFLFFFYLGRRGGSRRPVSRHTPRPCRRSTFMAATVSRYWLERSSSSALRNTCLRSRRPGPVMWPPPWRRPLPWSRRGYRQRCGELGGLVSRPRWVRVSDRRARQRRVGYQLNAGRPGSLGHGYGESTGGGRPVGRRDGVSGRRSAARSGAGGRRGDLPVRREVRRACKRSALEAALAEHRHEALADIDENVLARSSGPFQSRFAPGLNSARHGPSSPGPFRWRPFAASRRRSVAAATALLRTISTRRWPIKSGFGNRRSTRCSRRRCGGTPGQSSGASPAAGSRRSSRWTGWLHC